MESNSNDNINITFVGQIQDPTKITEFRRSCIEISLTSSYRRRELVSLEGGLRKPAVKQLNVVRLCSDLILGSRTSRSSTMVFLMFGLQGYWISQLTSCSIIWPAERGSVAELMQSAKCDSVLLLRDGTRIDPWDAASTVPVPRRQEPETAFNLLLPLGKYPPPSKPQIPVAKRFLCSNFSIFEKLTNNIINI